MRLAIQGESTKELKRIMLIGLFFRICVLIFILTIGEYFSEPYYISDDRTYELLAKRYLEVAQSPYDLNAFKFIGAYGYLEVFWPWVMCISAKLFGSIYIGRILNCFIAVANIKLVYDLAMQVCENKTVALRAAKLMAFLPVMIFVCCFPIKDIFLMYAVLNTFLLLVHWQNNARISFYSIVWEAFLLLAINHTRGAIVEALFLIFVLFTIAKIKKSNNNALVYIMLMVLFTMMIYNLTPIIEAFQVKVDTYGDVVETGNFIKVIQMRNPWEIYKLPFSYFYATLQPFLLNLFEFGGLSMWAFIINLANITIYPIAIGNYIYIIMKKHNKLLWLSSTVLMAAISGLSLGNSRHYFFMMPYTILNFCLAIERPNKICEYGILIGPFVIFIIVILMTAR